MTKMTDNVKNILQKKFEIIDHFSFLNFDYRFEWLVERLNQNKKDYYTQNEKIIVEHWDTDYYFPECSVGINFRNFFQIIKNLDISPSVFILWTNYVGIQNEVDILCSNFHENDRPIIIQTLLQDFPNNKNEFKDINYNFSDIQYNSLCMINEIRSYRSALYHSLKNIEKTKIALKLTGGDNKDVS